ncbi:MAG TPA: hypothetical protein VK468_09770 [Pyrinomonadaceae bacterium]|nr:hypothetical protein [Pyrinomonadaceae bacterium]
MKFISETKALERLRQLKIVFARRIETNFERNAKSCETCETPGACCLDAHFVNVRISRLEAEAIRQTLETLGPERRQEVYRRVDDVVEKYQLTEVENAAGGTYACPLFEKGTGCLVHSTGKPLPCIQHACYENEKDLPPDELLAEQEGLVDDLNRRVYGRHESLVPLPIAIRRSLKP